MVSKCVEQSNMHHLCDPNYSTVFGSALK